MIFQGVGVRKGVRGCLERRYINGRRVREGGGSFLARRCILCIGWQNDCNLNLFFNPHLFQGSSRPNYTGLDQSKTVLKLKVKTCCMGSKKSQFTHQIVLTSCMFLIITPFAFYDLKSNKFASLMLMQRMQTRGATTSQSRPSSVA